MSLIEKSSPGILQVPFQFCGTHGEPLLGGTASGRPPRTADRLSQESHLGDLWG